MSKLRAPVAGAARSGHAGTRALRSCAAAVGGAVALALIGAPAGVAADTCANAEIRAAQGATHLPDCRAYEWVSSENPGANLAGVDAALRPSASYARADGDKLLYFGSSLLGPAERGIVQLHHFGERTANGWRTRAGLSMTSSDAMTDTLSSSQGSVIPSGDLSAFGFMISRTLGPPNPVLLGGSQYVSRGVGTEWWVSEPEPGITPVASNGVVLGGTPDFSTVYFTSTARLTRQNGDATRSGLGIYERRGDVLRPAGVLPDGTVPPAGVMPAGGDTAPGSSADEPLRRRNHVSADGRRVFFTAVVGGVRQLYVREDGSTTRLLSHALGAPDTPSAEGVANLAASNGLSAGYAFATPDGTRVVFRSRGVLAPGAESAPADSVKTYRADVATGALTYLPEVDGAPSALDADASRMLWHRADPGGRSIHFWDEQTGRSRLVDDTRPQTSTEIAWVGGTADGSVWTLQSLRPLDPAFPDTNGRSQVYRWEIGDAAPTCLSCMPGARYTGNANLTSFSVSATEDGGGGSGNPAMRGQIGPRSMSADGERVFFDTTVALVAADRNEVRDVYMWEKGRGVTLLSGGAPSDPPSWFADASASGDDAFLITTAGLDPADRNGNYDLYDVRVGGGFAAVPEPDCAGDGCQPPAGPRAPSSAPGSDQPADASRGPDEIAPAPARIAAARVVRARGGATLRLSVTGPGVVRITGRRVRTVRRSVARKGALKVRLRLTSAARRTLARRGRVAVAVRVRFVPRGGPAVTTTVRTTIKRKR